MHLLFRSSTNDPKSRERVVIPTPALFYLLEAD